jgi:hypothetical protein
MGTISDKLMRIINTKEDIRQALISKGYDVPTSIPFKEYAKMISDLPCRVDSFPDIEGIVARYSALGLTNEQMAANPVWVDKTGNGHDIQLKNFSWKGMSGVGGYGDENYQTFYKFTLDDYVFIATPPGVKHMNFTFRVTGLQPGNKLTLAFFGTTNTVYGTWNKDGIYTVDADIVEAGKPTYFYNGYSATRGEFTIEILPLYPGALVFDGVDDYGACDNFPILTKEKGYTVVALRQWISMGEGISGLVSNVKNWFNDGAFLLEYNSNNATNKFVNRPVSFGNINIEMDLPNNFTYQTSKSYKGVPITTGSFEGTNSLFVGKLNNIIGNCSNVAIWELVFLDHDATEEELTKIKDYFVKTYPWLFPDQAWTVVGKTNEDEDRATIANITGNGNDLVLSNFGFAEGSGYGLYAQNYISYAITNRAVYTKTNSSIHVTKSIKAGVNFTESARNVTIPSYRIKVTGIQSGQEMIYRGSNNTFLTNIPSDGIYVLPAVENGSNLGFQFVSYTGDCDITIEQIPEYEGYLITDGVDDRVESSLFTLNKDWTIVGNWTMLSNIPSNCGIIKVSSTFLYNSLDGVTIYFAGEPIKIQSKSINAFCSDGRIYLNDWTEILKPDVQIASGGSKSSLNIASYSANFTKMAFKNLAIYDGKNLSKDDCIKAYNYLQTLKSK